MAPDYPKVTFVHLDIGSTLAAEYKVTATPTFHLLEKGVWVDEMIGRDYQGGLEKMIARYLEKTVKVDQSPHPPASPALGQVQPGSQEDPEPLQVQFAQLALNARPPSPEPVPVPEPQTHPDVKWLQDQLQSKGCECDLVVIELVLNNSNNNREEVLK